MAHIGRVKSSQGGVHGLHRLLCSLATRLDFENLGPKFRGFRVEGLGSRVQVLGLVLWVLGL